MCDLHGQRKGSEFQFNLLDSTERSTKGWKYARRCYSSHCLHGRLKEKKGARNSVLQEQLP